MSVFVSPRAGMACLLLMGLLGACGPSENEEVVRTDDGTLRVGAVETRDTMARGVSLAGRTLSVEGLRGTVRLVGEDRETADVSFVRRARGDDPDAAREALRSLSVVESGTEDTYTYSVESDTRRPSAYAAVDVQGRVPRATTLRIERMEGPIGVTDVDGPITVRHTHGPVVLWGTAASVDVEVENGDVVVGLRALPPDASVSLRTVNGDVAVDLPSDVSAQVKAQTRAGNIRTSGLDPSTERLESLDAGGRYRAELGTGAASIDVGTRNGTVTLRAADTLRAVPSGLDALEVPPSDTVVTVGEREEPHDTGRAETTVLPDTAVRDTTGL